MGDFIFPVRWTGRRTGASLSNDPWGSDVIVTARVGSQNSAHMRLTQDNELVHTLAPDRSDQQFSKAINKAFQREIGDFVCQTQNQRWMKFWVH